MHQPYGLGNSASDPSGYDLPLTEHRSASVHPADDYQIPRDVPMGVLDEDGRFIRNSGLERYRNIVLAEPRPEHATDLPFIDEEVVFAGYISHHYGHFLLESLARYWAYKDSDLRIVWATGRSFTGWAHQVMRFLSLKRTRHIVLREPARFAKIWVPAPGYIIPGHFHRRQIEALATLQGVAGEEKVYLARHAFQSKLYHVDREAELTERLRALGWRIVTPEDMPVAEQVAIFATARTVAGIEGSALHTCILCKDMKSRLIMLRRPTANRNYDTIAQGMGIKHFSVKARIADDPANPKRATIPDPAGTAAIIEALARD